MTDIRHRRPSQVDLYPSCPVRPAARSNTWYAPGSISQPDGNRLDSRTRIRKSSPSSSPSPSCQSSSSSSPSSGAGESRSNRDTPEAGRSAHSDCRASCPTKPVALPSSASVTGSSLAKRGHTRTDTTHAVDANVYRSISETARTVAIPVKDEWTPAQSPSWFSPSSSPSSSPLYTSSSDGGGGPKPARVIPQAGQKIRTTRRRCVSADATLNGRSLFKTPDRYLSPRPPAGSARTTFQVSRAPTTLGDNERYDRQRDRTVNPFQPRQRSRSRTAVLWRSSHDRTGARVPHYIPSFVHGTDAAPMNVNVDLPEQSPRQISAGGVWNVGGRSAAQNGQVNAVTDGSGGLLASGSNAPLHTAHFLDHETRTDQVRSHESRLALALDIDPASRVLGPPPTPPSVRSSPSPTSFADSWQSAILRNIDSSPGPRTKRTQKAPEKAVPITPFRVLDAPQLKDDYYCTALSYSHTHRTLAVALLQRVYLWTEQSGVWSPPIPQSRSSNYVTSLVFSSTQGGKAILAVARHCGTVLLWAIRDSIARFQAPHPHPISCVSFRPTVTHRPSTAASGVIEPCEDLLAGDDVGNIYYYSVQWPESMASSQTVGSMTLLVRISAHSQQVCGFAWCADGEYFASGGNDNTVLVFRTARVLAHQQEEQSRGRSLYSHSPATRSPRASDRGALPTPPTSPVRSDVGGGNAMLPSAASRYGDLDERPAQTAAPLPHAVRETVEQQREQPLPEVEQPPRLERARPRRLTPHRPPAPLPLRPAPPDAPSPSRLSPMPTVLRHLSYPAHPAISNLHSHRFMHSAAVKALAFAPWQPTLLATGGGSNDRQIHFHHTGSGAALAIINVFAQVTSLIWSHGRREIAATFGYASPEHDVRIAVFAWPSCDVVVKIPWEKKSILNGLVQMDVPRALWAVGYPGGPNDAASRSSTPNATPAPRPRMPPVRPADVEDVRRRFEGLTLDADNNPNDPPRETRGTIFHTLPRTTTTPPLTPPTSSPRAPLRSPRLPTNPPSPATEGRFSTSRTEAEGSLIIACCDSTVKFFEIWAGTSKGTRAGRGLGIKGGVLGGSRILEGELDVFDDEHARSPTRGRGMMNEDVLR